MQLGMKESEDPGSGAEPLEVEGDVASDPGDHPLPGPGHRRLDVFLGRWRLAGQQFESPFGPAARISGWETYDWLLGGFFLIHRLEGRLGAAPMGCIEVIGHDAATDSYPMRTFYNDGRFNEWRASEREGIWTTTGEWALEAESLSVRCTTLFEEGGATRMGRWEYSSPSWGWQTFWDVQTTRID